jgi:N-acetylglucosamine-6-phosphate deacetylase
METWLIGARIFDGAKMWEDHALRLRNGRVAGLLHDEKPPSSARTVKLQGGILAPGFIDVQVNGGGGALLNADPSVATLRKIAESHRRYGTVGLMPTVITDKPEIITQAIAAVTEARQAGLASILGIHIEGPHLDPVRKGAHAEKYMRAMTPRDLAALLAVNAGIVMTTVAPNRVTPKQIEALTKRGIKVSLGHSDAIADEANAAITSGANAFTHLFNAMSQMTAREPGMVGAALASDAYASLIADGHHVARESVRAAIKAKGADRCMLISDAMPPAAGGPQRFTLQGREVTRNKGRLTLTDGTLAGSNLTMDEAVRWCVRNADIGLQDALRMASRTPAEFLGLGDKLGRIAPGYLASVVHLGDDLTVKQTWINGT